MSAKARFKDGTVLPLRTPMNAITGFSQRIYDGKVGDPVSPEQKGFQGAGLGLNLSKRLAALLGGDLTVVSECGKGSTFTVHMPYSI